MKTKMQQTSLVAYMEIKDSLTKRENQVYSMLERMPMTKKQLATMLHLDINQVTGRTNSLHAKGLVRIKGYFKTPREREQIIYEVCAERESKPEPLKKKTARQLINELESLLHSVDHVSYRKEVVKIINREKSIR